jgi:acetoin utilization protein AcuB
MSLPRRIEDNMSEYPSIASRSMPLTQAAEFMRTQGIRHLPVLEGGAVVGILSDRDLRNTEAFADSMHLVVADVMTASPYCVPVGTPLIEVARTMTREKYGSAIVLNRIGSVVGIFTTTDAMKLLTELLEDENSPEFKLWGVERLLTAVTSREPC